jgi:hypothetical protein
MASTGEGPRRCHPATEELIMTSMHKVSVLVAAFTLASAAAAQSFTREQVRAQLQQAQASGMLIAAGELGLAENELNPGSYAPAAEQPGPTRAQVREGLAQALRSGDYQVGESGLTERELRHAGPAAGPMLTSTRAEVRAELAQAIANGDYAVGDTGLTARELSPRRFAQVKPQQPDAVLAMR